MAVLVLVAECRLSLVAASEDYPLVAAHMLNCLKALGIFPDQSLNHSPLHCKADSYALDNPESSTLVFTLGNRIAAALGQMESTPS